MMSDAVFIIYYSLSCFTCKYGQ